MKQKLKKEQQLVNYLNQPVQVWIRVKVHNKLIEMISILFTHLCGQKQVLFHKIESNEWIWQE